MKVWKCPFIPPIVVNIVNVGAVGMQSENKLFEDLARLAGGVTHIGSSMKQELESKAREQAEVIAGKLDLVSREEYEVLREMVAKLREEQEAMKAELADLRKALVAKPDKAAKPKPATGKQGKT